MAFIEVAEGVQINTEFVLRKIEQKDKEGNKIYKVKMTDGSTWKVEESDFNSI